MTHYFHSQHQAMRILKKLSIRNFKSIREQKLELGQLNIFIGGNGSGKSNLIQIFHFLREIYQQNLQNYVGRKYQILVDRV